MKYHAHFFARYKMYCRSPCGERGLKLTVKAPTLSEDGRSPCGERGLKFVALPNPFSLSRSLPVRGAWIEIVLRANTVRSPCRSLPVRGAWIEIRHTTR